MAWKKPEVIVDPEGLPQVEGLDNIVMEVVKPDICLSCPLYKEPGIVWGEGLRSADMFFLGEAPGAEEVELQYWKRDENNNPTYRRVLRPFVGGAGRILSSQMAQADIHRPSTYISNVVKCRPPDNRLPTDDEIRHCARFLIAELEEVKPNVVVAMGKTALYALTGRTDITKRRGIPLEGSGLKVFPMFHPAYIMRNQGLWPLSVHDLVRAKSESGSKVIRRIEVVYNTHASNEVDGATLLHRARQAGHITFDLETTGLDPRVHSINIIGYSTKPGEGESYAWTLGHQQVAAAIFADPNVEKVTQNGEKFDIWFCEEKGFKFAGPSFDTLVVFHLLNSDLPKDLGTVSSYYTDMEYWKDTAGDDLALYNCKDVDGTERSYHGEKEQLARLGMNDLYYKHVMPVQPVLRRMYKKGIHMNTDKADMWAYALRKKADQEEEILRAGLGDPFLNIQSPKQLAALLYGKLGLPVQYTKGKDGFRPTCNADAMDQLALITDNKIFHRINKVRTLRQHASTFLDVFRDEQGFVHPMFGTSKAANGRLNSWEPNAQNIPLELREVYIPDDDDCILIAADWSQIEWRVAMVQSADPTGLEYLTKGVDNHKAIAAEGFGVRYEDVDDDLRTAAKFIVYGLGYGRGVRSIAKQLQKDEAWVDAFVKRFFARFSRYSTWRTGLEKTVAAQHYLSNPFGRRRWWYTRQVTEMYNFPPSSTAADMMYVALRQCDAQMPKGASVRLTVHDELVVNAHKDTVRLAHECLRDVMEQKWDLIVNASSNPQVVKRFYPTGWHCPAEIVFGSTWRATKGKRPEDKEFDKSFRKQMGIK